MLLIAKRPKYLSPSSLAKFEGQPNSFYLERLAPNPKPYEPQSMPGGVGSSFDSFVKLELIQKLNIVDIVKDRLLTGIYDSSQRDYYRDKPIEQVLLELSVEKQNREEAIPAGKQLYNQYKSCPFYRETKFMDIEIHRSFTLYTCGVPLYMKLDAAVDLSNLSNLSNLSTPFDWKVSGYGSKEGASPKIGYYMNYDCNTCQLKPPHSEYKADIEFSFIDRGWATQLATYGWGLGIPIGKPFKAIVDNLIIRPTGTRIVRYIGWITEQFQLELAGRYKYAWESIMSGEFLRSLVSERKLISFLASQESWY